MAKNDVVALVDPHQKRLLVMIGEMNQAERNGILAPLADSPPSWFQRGFPRRRRALPIRVPVGFEFLGQPFGEPHLLQIVRLRAGDARPQTSAVYAAAEWRSRKWKIC
jgi:amidase